MNLSKHFTLAEFTFSETAARNHIDNDPPASLYPTLRNTAEGMELVRTFLGNLPIRITSGYRCEAVEKILTYKAYVARCNRKGLQVNAASWADYFATKAHPKGESTDFQCQAYGDPMTIVRDIANSDIGFDQLICEFDSWVHISFVAAPRRQVLVIDRNGTRPL